MMTLVYILVGTGLLAAVLGVPLALRRVKRNPFFGVRRQKTLSSDRIWYKANAYAGGAICITGTLQAILTAVFYAVCLKASGQSLFITACSITVVGIWMVCIIAVLSYVDTLK
ncbi:MAG: SdpI family protein [Capsulimonadaceae bacterium]